MGRKKSLYEILAVSNDASYPDIRAAHQSQLAKLLAQQALLSREELNLQTSLLKVAFDTLCAPSSRDAYDAQLASQAPPTPPRAALAVHYPTGPSSASAAQRADAMLLRAQALELYATAGPGLLSAMVGNPTPAAGVRTMESAKRVLLVVGTVVALVIVLRLCFLYWARGPHQNDPPVSRQAAERIYLDEYHQTWGVRPANRAEADSLDAERSRVAAVQRREKAAQDMKRQAEDAEREFEEKSRQRADQVSNELLYAKERAAQQEREQEQIKRAKVERARAQEEEERRKAEAQQEKWRKSITTPSGG